MKAVAASSSSPNPLIALLKWAWPLPVLVVLLLWATGCGTGSRGPGSVTLRPVAQDETFAKRFEQAYVSRSTDGSIDAVLVDDDAVRLAAAATAGDPCKPLTAAPAMPLRQVVHIRVLWRPLVGTESDNPSATNAAINWYVFGGGGSEQWTDLLHYGGAGFVTVSGTGGDNRRIDIRNATLKPLASQGGLSDPLGHTRLEGTLVARHDPARVQELLTETRQTVATIGQAPKTAAHTINP